KSEHYLYKSRKNTDPVPGLRSTSPTRNDTDSPLHRNRINFKSSAEYSGGGEKLDQRPEKIKIFSNMEQGLKPSEVPLLPDHHRSSSGTASTIQTIGNIIVSIVGTGILGLPYALRVAGWFAGSFAIVLAGISTYYCMVLLVQCRNKVSSQEELTTETTTYGDLGQRALGKTGRYLAESFILISQCGGAVAYLLFIGQNLSSVLNFNGFTTSTFIFMLVPIEVALCWIGSLSALAPFSIFADVCNLLAMAIVVKEDALKLFGGGDFKFSERQAISSDPGGLPFALGMAVFCFEGFGMTLALEQSMKESGKFRGVLAKAVTGIASLYIVFGFFGYMAYGDETRDIITLNLTQNWSNVAVKIGMCTGLVFTFPIMVHPINEIVEGKLRKIRWFHKTDNDDALFHLKLLGSSLPMWRKALDYFIMVCGVLFAVYGTISTIISA
ncbi:Amino acid transporter ANT1, partial [Linum perenne]